MNRLPIVALLAAVLLIPLGTTWAQEGEAKPDACLEKVWAKLQAAVKEGKMSAEDAEAKMIAIKKSKASAGKNIGHHEAIAEKLKAAVKADKLTEEQAWAKWKAITTGQAAQPGSQAKKAKIDAYFEEAWATLQAAVKEGKMSAADADAKMIAIKKAKLGGGSKDAVKKDIDYEAIGKKLKAAVQAGKLTKEEAKAKWAAIKKAKINAKK
jgi:hypothetical protein